VFICFETETHKKGEKNTKSFGWLWGRWGPSWHPKFSLISKWLQQTIISGKDLFGMHVRIATRQAELESFTKLKYVLLIVLKS
jgi:hypothetical protein